LALCVASRNSWNFRSGRVDVGTFAKELLRDLVVTKPEMGVAHDLSLEEAAEFIEFLSTQTLPSDTVVLSPGNTESHGWVLFSTANKWIGPWKEREDFVLNVWMKDKVWQFPFSLPPSEGDLILRKPPD